ncbi:MAG: 1-deoxy-D-xylulose-5-phosphate synthase, partial [Clostridia bacterium]|nr:1-deoxy-D-xylulose-5-phosphate synthase [Clostridia bacterium]
DAGQSKSRMIVIVNDNEMSISKNVGGISNHLSNLRTGNLYNRFRRKVKKLVENAPILKNMAHKLHSSFKYSMVPNTIFESLGFRYIGPIDGHNLTSLSRFSKGLKPLKEIL